MLAEAKLKATQQELNVDAIQVQPGDTIDFVVDILAELSHDQFLWAPKIERVDASNQVAKVESTKTSEASSASVSLWDAQRDFFGPAEQPLSRLEQLGQVLMLSNEFAFVD
ncbi:MAG: hypothetical protein U0930_13255 [Pirellulales bacterium]